MATKDSGWRDELEKASKENAERDKVDQWLEKKLLEIQNNKTKNDNTQNQHTNNKPTCVTQILTVPDHSSYSLETLLISLSQKTNNYNYIIKGSLGEYETIIGADAWILEICRKNLYRVLEEQRKIEQLCQNYSLNCVFEETENTSYRFGKEALVTNTTYSITVKNSDIIRLKNNNI